MTQPRPTTLTNIAHAFAGEMEARDERLLAAIRAEFAQVKERLDHHEKRFDEIDSQLREMRQALGYRQGQKAGGGK